MSGNSCRIFSAVMVVVVVAIVVGVGFGGEESFICQWLEGIGS